MALNEAEVPTYLRQVKIEPGTVPETDEIQTLKEGFERAVRVADFPVAYTYAHDLLNMTDPSTMARFVVAVAMQVVPIMSFVEILYPQLKEDFEYGKGLSRREEFLTVSPNMVKVIQFMCKASQKTDVLVSVHMCALLNMIERPTEEEYNLVEQAIKYLNDEVANRKHGTSWTVLHVQDTLGIEEGPPTEYSVHAADFGKERHAEISVLLDKDETDKPISISDDSQPEQVITANEWANRYKIKHEQGPLIDDDNGEADDDDASIKTETTEHDDNDTDDGVNQYDILEYQEAERLVGIAILLLRIRSAVGPEELWNHIPGLPTNKNITNWRILFRECNYNMLILYSYYLAYFGPHLIKDFGAGGTDQSDVLKRYAVAPKELAQMLRERDVLRTDDMENLFAHRQLWRKSPDQYFDKYKEEHFNDLLPMIVKIPNKPDEKSNVNPLDGNLNPWGRVSDQDLLESSAAKLFKRKVHDGAPTVDASAYLEIQNKRTRDDLFAKASASADPLAVMRQLFEKPEQFDEKNRLDSIRARLDEAYKATQAAKRARTAESTIDEKAEKAALYLTASVAPVVAAPAADGSGFVAPPETIKTEKKKRVSPTLVGPSKKQAKSKVEEEVDDFDSPLPNIPSPASSSSSAEAEALREYYPGDPTKSYPQRNPQSLQRVLMYRIKDGSTAPFLVQNEGSHRPTIYQDFGLYENPLGVITSVIRSNNLKTLLKLQRHIEVIHVEGEVSIMQYQSLFPDSELPLLKTEGVHERVLVGGRQVDVLRRSVPTWKYEYVDFEYFKREVSNVEAEHTDFVIQVLLIFLYRRCAFCEPHSTEKNIWFAEQQYLLSVNDGIFLSSTAPTGTSMVDDSSAYMRGTGISDGTPFSKAYETAYVAHREAIDGQINRWIQLVSSTQTTNGDYWAFATQRDSFINQLRSYMGNSSKWKFA